jgi:hypothetical protein
VTSRRDGTGAALVCRRPGARGCYSLMRTESRLARTGAHRPVKTSDQSPSGWEFPERNINV